MANTKTLKEVSNGSIADKAIVKMTQNGNAHYFIVEIVSREHGKVTFNANECISEHLDAAHARQAYGEIAREEYRALLKAQIDAAIVEATRFAEETAKFEDKRDSASMTTFARSYYNLLVRRDDVYVGLEETFVNKAVEVYMALQTAPAAAIEVAEEVTESVVSDVETVQGEASIEPHNCECVNHAARYERDDNATPVVGSIVDFKIAGSPCLFKVARFYSNNNHFLCEIIGHPEITKWEDRVRVWEVKDVAVMREKTLTHFAVIGTFLDAPQSLYAVVATPDGVRHETALRATPDEVLADVARLYGHNTINVSLERVHELTKSLPLQQQEQLQHASQENQLQQNDEIVMRHILKIYTIVTFDGHNVTRQQVQDACQRTANNYPYPARETVTLLSRDIETGYTDDLVTGFMAHLEDIAHSTQQHNDEQPSRPMQRQAEQQQKQYEESPTAMQTVLDMIQKHIDRYAALIAKDKDAIQTSYASGQTNVDYLQRRIDAFCAKIDALSALDHELDIDHSGSEDVQADDTTNYYRGLGL